jgi:hypothetical protein
MYEYVSHEFLPLINWSFLNHSIFVIADGLADITQWIISNVFSMTVSVVGNSFWFHDILIMGLTKGKRKKMSQSNDQTKGSSSF